METKWMKGKKTMLGIKYESQGPVKEAKVWLNMFANPWNKCEFWVMKSGKKVMITAGKYGQMMWIKESTKEHTLKEKA